MYHGLNENGTFKCRELDENGNFVADSFSSDGLSDWTLLPLPQPALNPRVVGSRDNETGEWTGEWVVDTEVLPKEQKQKIVWEGIKAERDRRTQLGGYQAAGNWFHSDTFSRSQIIGLVLMGASIPAGLVWMTMGGTVVQRSQQLAADIFAAAAAQDQAIFTAAEIHNATMMGYEEPELYDYSGGWPLAHGE